MAVNKTFNITLDVSQALTDEGIRIKQGDTGNIFVIALVDDGVAVDLTGCRVVALFTKGNRLAMQDSWTDDGGVTIGGDNSNIITIDLFNGSFAPGLNTCEIQVYSGEALDTLITTASFNFYCARSLINEETIVSMQEYTLLTSLIAQVQAAINGTQSDFAEDDVNKLQFIKNKPAAYPPTNHAAAHAAGEVDEFLHATQHAHDGADAIPPTVIKAVGYGEAQEIPVAEQAIARENIGAARVIAETVTLTVAGWTGAEAPYSQQLLVNSIPEDCQILPAASVGHGEVYGDCEIKATEHELRKITFTCESKPDVAVNVNLLIFC